MRRSRTRLSGVGWGAGLLGLAAAVVGECLARDMWIYPAGSAPVPDAVMIGCPFTITEAEIELLVETLAAAIDAAAAGG